MPEADLTAPAFPDILPVLSQNPPVTRAAYSDRTCALMAWFSELAYVDFTDLAAEAGLRTIEAKLNTGGFKLVTHDDQRNMQALLAVMPGVMAVLVYRGTSNAADWGINLDARLTDLPGPSTIKVHEGFLEAYQVSAQKMRAAIRDLAKTAQDQGDKPPPLYVTGHSLGGGVAQIAAADLEQSGVNLAACYTFGSPRAGGEGLDELIKCPHYRVVNESDLVPCVPPPWFHGYRHTGDARFLPPGQPSAIHRGARDAVAEEVALTLAMPVWLTSQTLKVVADHMIWNYREKLEFIAQARNPGR